MIKSQFVSKDDKIAAFDPNGPAASDNLYGLPFSYAESETIVLPVPWEATVSYRTGTSKAPEAIKRASAQVDLFDPLLKDAWKRGIYMVEVDSELEDKAKETRLWTEEYLEGADTKTDGEDLLHKINQSSQEMIRWVKEHAIALLDDGKRVALLGGDHSTPEGFLQALAARHEDFGILQVDAHADLRQAYEGFEHSHASIMFNALKLPQVSVLTQVGVRDYCDEEHERIVNEQRVHCFFDQNLKFEQFEGSTWHQQCERIVATLPEKVYLSFDIDGLKPYLCPNTGTPVAGGLEIEEVLYLLKFLVASGRRLIGLDLNEVTPAKEGDWDANVGARLLYRLCNLMALSQE